jgi:3-hydroxybutyryl-CoA dehydrogenase
MEIKTIAVIGAGKASREIACAAALGGYRTILEDVSSDVLERAFYWIKREIDEGVAEGRVKSSARDGAQGNLSTASTVEEAIRTADLIIDTTAEEIEMKIELFTVFDKFAKPDAIFASNAAALSITEMAEVTFCAERCIGMRFRAGDGVELVRGMETSQETVTACCEAGQRMGKRVVVVGDLERSLSAAGHS